MKLKISNLGEGSHSFSFEGVCEELGLKSPYSGSYNLEIEVQKQSRSVICKCELDADAFFECDRCSIDYTTKINTKFDVCFLVDPNLSRAESDKDVKYITPEADKIDISEEIYDFANLSIPWKRLCKEDCLGLCYRCGTDLNLGKCDCVAETANPVWAQLDEIKKKLNL